MTQKFANNFATTVAATFGISDTTLTLASVAGLPSLTGGHTLLLTVYRLSGVEESGHEVVEVTGISGNIATVTRAVEGAAASQFLTGDRVELRITAGSMQPLANHVASTSNPHNVTAIQVGLGSVDNTSDTDKPVSTAQQTALDGKQATLVSATNIKTLNGLNLLGAGDILTTDVAHLDKGTVSSGTATFDYAVAGSQRLQVGGGLTIALTNLPTSGRRFTLLLELVNAGSAAVTFPTINWVKPDGTTTTTLSSYLTAISRPALQTSGTDFVLLWGRDAGDTTYGKLL